MNIDESSDDLKVWLNVVLHLEQERAFIKFLVDEGVGVTTMVQHEDKAKVILGYSRALIDRKVTEDVKNNFSWEMTDSRVARAKKIAGATLDPVLCQKLLDKRKELFYSIIPIEREFLTAFEEKAWL